MLSAIAKDRFGHLWTSMTNLDKYPLLEKSEYECKLSRYLTTVIDYY